MFLGTLIVDHRLPDGRQADASDPGRARRYHEGTTRQETHSRCPRRDLPDRPARRHRRQRPPRRRAARHRRRGGLPRRGIRDLAWTAAFSTDEATTAAAQWLVWEASQELGARSASIQALYEARARGEVSGFTVPAINLRTQTFDMARTVYEAAAAADVARGHPRTRPQRADLHVPAPDRLRDLGPGRRHRRGLAGPGLHPGRPLPVQRQEVRRRPRGDDRGDPARLPPGGRCRLSQHRHRFVDAGRPVEADRRRAAARELRPRRRTDRA